MRKAIVLSLLAVLFLASSIPTFAYDQTGTIGLGYRFGLHTVGKDPWAMKFMHGGEFKLGLHPRIALAVTGTYARTDGAKIDDAAFPAVFADANKDDAMMLKMRNYIVEVGPVINLMPEDAFNIFLTGGVGVGAWSIKDLDGNVAEVSDGAGGMLKLNDQQLTLMIGAGFEWWPWENVPEISFGASARYHAFTSVLSNFKDPSTTVDQAVGSDGVDLPSGLLEFAVGVTAYLSKCPDEDGDGVCDEFDQCPGTPECVDSVDENGCPYDSDGDGVFDGCDACPDTPVGCKVDLKGCPYDSDEDGVCDGVDKCPDTEKGCQVDAVGCPIDTDKDGVPDCKDKCPGTPTCCKVDASGCELDSDNDGVCDGCDKCPGTPPGYKVDANGCPEGYKVGQQTIFEDVTFATNKATLTKKAMGKLDEFAEALKAMPHVRIEIQGHCDNTDGHDWNMKLSQMRADAVVNYFVEKGLAKDRFVAKGYGDTKPKADNGTAEGRAQNRRVEFVRMN